MSSSLLCTACNKTFTKPQYWKQHMLLKHPGVQVSDPTVQIQTPSQTVPRSQTPASTPSTTPPAPSSTVPAGLPDSIYLASRVELPKTLNLTKAVPLQPVSTVPPTEPQAPTSTSAESKGESEGSKGVEQQKKTVESTPETPQTPPAPSTVPSPQVYILPVPETLLQSGHRDQPRMVVVDESKGEEREPVISTEGLKGGLPAEVTTHQVELSTAAPKIALSHKTFLLYDYARGVGFKGSLADFIEQTIEDYFAERKIRVTVSREA